MDAGRQLMKRDSRFTVMLSIGLGLLTAGKNKEKPAEIPWQFRFGRRSSGNTML
jgi:hypothetical protein